MPTYVASDPRAPAESHCPLSFSALFRLGWVRGTPSQSAARRAPCDRTANFTRVLAPVSDPGRRPNEQTRLGNAILRPPRRGEAQEGHRRTAGSMTSMVNRRRVSCPVERLHGVEIRDVTAGHGRVHRPRLPQDEHVEIAAWSRAGRHRDHERDPDRARTPLTRGVSHAPVAVARSRRADV